VSISVLDSYQQQKEFLDLDELTNYADTVAKVLAMESGKQPPSSLEFVTLQIAASSFSVLFSIRELIKLGYFPSTRILLRSLLDRTATIAWIRCNPEEGIKIWENGWRKGKRPEHLSTKMSCLHKFKIFIDDERNLEQYLIEEKFIGDFHGDVHGDLASSRRDRLISTDGDEYYVAGPILHDVGQLKKTCRLASMIVGQFLKEIDVSLPNIAKKKETT
jgi:hypothetical protein